MPISDRELWACALEVMKQHGTDAPRFAADRVKVLQSNGDIAGVITWRAIAARIEALEPAAPAVQ